jgi:hypothetical protein
MLLLVYIIEVIAYKHFAHFQLCSAPAVKNRLQSSCASLIEDRISMTLLPTKLLEHKMNDSYTAAKIVLT